MKFKNKLAISALSLSFCSSSPAATVFIGDAFALGDATLPSAGNVDGFSSGVITYVNTTNSYTNNSGADETVTIQGVNFHAANAGQLTPFLAKYNGAGVGPAANYDVITIGQPITATAGSTNNAVFTPTVGSTSTLTLSTTETLVTGWFQSAGIVNFSDGSGGVDYIAANNTIPGSVPNALTADANFSNLDRLYSFNVKLDVVPEPSSIALLGLAGLGLLRRRR